MLWAFQLSFSFECTDFNLLELKESLFYLLFPNFNLIRYFFNGAFGLIL